MEEIWKVINEKPKYMVSNFGRIKSKRMILKLRKNHRGYPCIDLGHSGEKKSFLVHRLVAIHFIPNPNIKPTVNHINGIKTDNRVENLEWYTYKEQYDHALKLGLINTKTEAKIKARIKNNKKTFKKVIDLKTGIIYESVSDAAGKNNLKENTLCCYLKRTRKNKTTLQYYTGTGTLEIIND